MHLRKLPILFAVLSSFLLAEEAKRLLQFPVQGEYQPIHSKRNTIQGEMPRGWREDSSWADVSVQYSAQTLNPHEGDRSLRIEVEQIRSGRVQWKLAPIQVSPDRIWRIRVPIRSEQNRSVTLSLRKQGPPYTEYWSQTLQASPEWSVQEMLASIKETDPAAGLYFAMESVGSLEVAEVQMESLSLEEALADREFEGNLLHRSSFPLGISAPWASGANGTREKHLSSDPSTIGPSGGPALRLETLRYGGRPMIQITSPFVGMPGAAHSFSFWAKSEKPGMELHLRMGPPSENLWVAPWQKTVHLSTEWKRYSFSVELPPAPGFTYLARVTSHAEGVFWIDQAMVEVGSQASAFQANAQVELHAKASRPLGLYLDDEEIQVQLATQQAVPAGSRIRMTLLDLYGQEQALRTVDVEDSTQPLNLTQLLPNPKSYGSFVLSLYPEDAQGNSLGNPAELLLHRVRSPRHLHRMAPESPFGTHFPTTPELLSVQKRLGFNWNRPHYRNTWTEYLQDDGSWDFSSLDRQIQKHEDAKLLTLINFGGVPRQYTYLDPQRKVRSWYRTTAAPRADMLNKWEEYCRKVLEHAGEHLAAIEVWNEPFLPGFFVGAVAENGRPIRGEPELMAEMMTRARNAAKASNYAGLLVWNTGPHYGDSELEFTRGVLAAGAAEQVDLISFHRYVSSSLAYPGDRFAEDVNILKREFSGKQAAARIWNSEGGHGNSYLFNLYRNVPPFHHREKAEEQASHAVRYYLSNFAAGAEKVFLYTMYPQDTWKPNYGYMNVDGQLSAVAPALSNLAWHLEGKPFAEMIALSPTLYAQRYGESEDAIWVLLPTGKGQNDLTEILSGARVLDLYGNPVSAPGEIGNHIWYVQGIDVAARMASQE